MSRRQRRIRAVLDAQFTVITTLLFVAVLVGAGMTYTAYADTTMKTTQKPGPEATYTGEFVHEATVERPSPVFATGQTLSDRSAYFTRLTPTLDGTFRYSYSASGSGNVTVDGDLTLVITSTTTSGEGEPTEYWRDTRTLDQVQQSLAPGESLELTFSENVTELINETQRIDEAVGGTPGTIETSVVADVETTGTVNGQPVERDQRYDMTIESDGGIYRVSGGEPVTNTTQQTRTIQVEESAGPLQRTGGPVVAAIGLCGLVGLGIVRYRGTLALTEGEAAYLSYETARAEFDDWVTSARLPQEAVGETVAEVDSLEGLVDIAIDSGRRVIEDGDGTFLVTTENVTYRYTAPPAPGPASWSPLFSSGSGAAPDDSWGDDGSAESGEESEESAETPASSTNGSGDEPTAEQKQ